MDIAMRALDARGGWVRLGDDLILTPADGRELAGELEEWLRPVTLLGLRGTIDERRGSLRAVGVALNQGGSGEVGSVGVLVDADSRPGFEGMQTLVGVARSLAAAVELWRESATTADGLHGLRVLAKAVGNMQLGLTLTDHLGRIVYTNRAEAEMHGYRAEELIGQDASILAPPDLRRKPNLGVERRDASWTRESVNRHRDGHDFPVLLWSDVIEGRDGGFRGVVTCSENLAPRRAMEAALQRSEQMFRAIFDNAPVGMALIGHDTWIIRANPLLATMLGIEGEAPGEHRLRDFVHPDDLEAADEYYAAAIAGEADAARLDCRMIPVDGRYIWVNATLSAITDGAGREPLWIALIEDNTKRRALEEELRHSQKMEAVGRLAGGVAHDFNNLLTAIVGITELLLLENGRTGPLAEDLLEIHRAAHTAADLTRQLLAFSRRQITHRQVQNLNNLIRSTESMLRRLVTDGVDLLIDLDPELDPIIADQSQMEQVILNLLVNARDASEEGDRIELRTRTIHSPPPEVDPPPSGRFVEVVVCDTGSGIDPVILEQIFDPFFTTKPKGRGTGLGLSTVYGIVKHAGGHIWVDSTVGIGTLFRIWLPAVEGRDAEHGANQSETVLVLIGDEERNLAFTQTLHEAGYRVITADSSEEAIDLVDTSPERIDLMLLDCDVFGMHGPMLAEQLRVPREDMAVVILGTEVEAIRETPGEFVTWLDPEIDSGPFLERVRTVLRGAR